MWLWTEIIELRIGPAADSGEHDRPSHSVTGSTYLCWLNTTF
jgi:hypothetical protein